MQCLRLSLSLRSLSDYIVMSKRFPKVLLITLVKRNYSVFANAGGNCHKAGQRRIFWLAPHAVALLFWKFAAPPVIRCASGSATCGCTGHLWSYNVWCDAYSEMLTVVYLQRGRATSCVLRVLLARYLQRGDVAWAWSVVRASTLSYHFAHKIQPLLEL